MTQKERMEKCKEFFKEITKELEDDYEVITGLDKQHYNALLIPKGTKGEVNRESENLAQIGVRCD